MVWMFNVFVLMCDQGKMRGCYCIMGTFSERTPMLCQFWFMQVYNFKGPSPASCTLLSKECDSMLCIVDCISEKGLQPEECHQKRELLQSALTRMPLINVFFMVCLLFFPFAFWLLRHFSCFRLHQHARIIGINLFSRGFADVLFWVDFPKHTYCFCVAWNA